MLCIIGAGSKQTEIDRAIEKYNEPTYGKREIRIRKEYSLNAKTDEIQSSLEGVFSHFHIQKIIENPSLRDIYNLLSHPEGKALLPNPPADKELYNCFRRQNELLLDQPRSWVQFDIDWLLLEGQTMTMPLRNRIEFALKRLGIPAGTGWVGQLSSSGWVIDERKPKDKRELSIRIYFLLEQPMTQIELQRAFQDVDVDTSMFEHARLHIIDYPIVDMDIETLETDEDVILKTGDRLNPSVLPKTKTCTQEFNPPTPGLKEKLQRNINKPNLFSLMRIGGYDYRNPYDHIAYYEDNADDLDGRNIMFYETLKVCYQLKGDFEPFYSEWNKKREDSSQEVWRKIKGKHKDSYINSKIKAIKKEFLEATTCGNIKNSFKGEAKTIVHLNTDYIYEDKERVNQELAEWEKSGGVLLLKAGCGSGKTSYVLDRVYHMANKPKRYCFITFRKSLISQTISKCEGKGKTFKPHHYERLGEYNEIQTEKSGALSREHQIARRKKQYLPIWNNPILCVDSLHYLENNGIENPFEVVFIDEIEHVLEGLWQEGNAQDFDSIMETRQSRWLQLIKICAKAKHVILADDKASNTLTGWFIDEVINYSDRKAWLLYNEKDLLTKKTIIDISDKATGYHLVKIKRLVKDGKVIALQTNRAVESLRPDISALIEAGIQKQEIFAIDAKQAFSELGEEYKFEMGKDTNLANDYRKNPNKVIPWLLDKGVKVFIHSPWNGVGWDYDGEGIDAVFVKLLYLPRIDSKDAIQYMSRFRLCDLIYIALPIKDYNKYQDILEKFKGESRRERQ